MMMKKKKKKKKKKQKNQQQKNMTAMHCGPVPTFPLSHPLLQACSVLFLFFATIDCILSFSNDRHSDETE